MSPSVSVRLLLTQSDARLVALAGDGHERAFEALVLRYRRPLLRYCRRLLLPNERAEDALQQGLMQAWLALQGGVEVKDARAWLYRIVHNTALNTLRVSGYDYCTLSESLSGADAPQADLERRIAIREALAGLASLPQMQREALLRTAVEGSSHAQVASELGVSEHALRGLVYRARASLRGAVTAITPPPLVAWAVSSSVRSPPFAEQLAGGAGGAGSAGLTGFLMKGGAVVVTAGTLATGIVGEHRLRHRNAAKAHSELAVMAMSNSVPQPSTERPVVSTTHRTATTHPLGSSIRRHTSTGELAPAFYESSAGTAHPNGMPPQRPMHEPVTHASPAMPVNGAPSHREELANYDQERLTAPTSGPSQTPSQDEHSPSSSDRSGESNSSTGSWEGTGSSTLEGDGSNGGGTPSSEETTGAYAGPDLQYSGHGDSNEQADASGAWSERDGQHP